MSSMRMGTRSPSGPPERKFRLGAGHPDKVSEGDHPTDGKTHTMVISTTGLPRNSMVAGRCSRLGRGGVLFR